MHGHVQRVRELRRRAGLTQAQLAQAAGTSQPTIAAYESGAKSPTLRTLRRLAVAAGLEVEIVFVPPMTREDRRSLELHRAIAEKLAQDPAAVRRIARRNLRRMSAANPGARRLLRAWGCALDGPDRDLIDLVVDPRPRARELRHVTPFAGVLSAAERWALYHRLPVKAVDR